MSARPRILLIDNYDSFTYNLVQAFLVLGADVHVYRNDAISLEAAHALEPTHLCISPGPGTPYDAQALARPDSPARLVRLLDFAPGQPLRDVPDPYYGEAADFARVAGLIDTGVRGFIAALRGRQPIA